MIGDAIGYPLRGEPRGDALAAAWALLLAHGIVPVVPLIPLVGLLVAAVAGSVRGDEGPPAIVDDPGGTLRDGVLGGLVVLAYAGVPSVYLLGMLHVVSGGSGSDQGSFLVLAAATVGGISLLVVAYLLPVGLASYATSGSVRAAFDPARLRRGARSGRYLIGWLAGVVVLDAAGLVGRALATRSLVGTWGTAAVLLAGLVVAYASLVSARLIGHGLAESGVAEA